MNIAEIEATIKEKLADARRAYDDGDYRECWALLDEAQSNVLKIMDHAAEKEDEK